MKKGITIIICTFNGVTKIAETLNHLALQNVPETLNWEIVIVDNGSKDNTSGVAVNEWKNHTISHVPLTIVNENKPGKLFAFQKGIALAKYEYFIVCDDDNWLAHDYLSVAFEILENNPDIGAVGGQTTAVTEPGLDFPDWFENVKAGYAVGRQTEHTGDITSRGHIWGAGLSSRTSLYKTAYNDFPSLLINKTDKKILSAEDTEYCLRLILMGYRLHYDTRLSLKHFIPAERLTSEYREGLFRNFSNAGLILEKYYLAIKFGLEDNVSLYNLIRLTLITPFRALFASSIKNKVKQTTILSYLLPSLFKPDHLTTQIKKFMLHHKD
ncbi:MAG TPA: glycosyltransferase [Pedobacter sp.]|nr:glycosyltransferase [Pedobacter sp.]